MPVLPDYILFLLYSTKGWKNPSFGEKFLVIGYRLLEKERRV
jgi:hypothetical protein